MQPKYIIYEQTGILSGSHLFCTWYEVGHLCQTVHKHSDGGFALGLWQVSDQVCSDLLPSSLRNRNGLQNTGLFPVIGFHALTNQTGPHICCDISPQTTPPVSSFDEVHSSVDPHVPYHRDIMVLN